MRQAPPTEGEQFHHGIQIGGVRVQFIGDGHEHCQLFRAEKGRFHQGLFGLHFVQIASNGIDFPVVGKVSKGLSQPPVWKGVGAKSGVNDGKGGGNAGILKVLEERQYLIRSQLSFVHYR